MKKLQLSVCMILITFFSVSQNKKTSLDIKATNNDTISVRLNILEDFRVDTTYYGNDTCLYGKIQVIINNNSKENLSLHRLEEHNLVFYNKKKKEVFVPYHTCSGVYDAQDPFWKGYYIKPGDSDTIYYDQWECKGSSFGIPDKGEYEIYFRAHFTKDLKNNFIYREFKRKGKTSISDTDRRCKELLYNDKFWAGAFYSKPGKTVIK